MIYSALRFTLLKVYREKTNIFSFCLKLKDLTKTSVKVNLIGVNCFVHINFQILVNVKVELTQNSNFRLELQFELLITFQLRQSVSSKKCMFQIATTCSKYI